MFQARWTWDHDCVVHGNVEGASGTAPAGTRHTLDGRYEACFDPPCPDNVRGELVQQLAEETPGSP